MKRIPCISCGALCWSFKTQLCWSCFANQKAADSDELQDQTLANRRASKRNWYYNNREHAKAKHKEWLDANRDKVKQYEVEHVVERRGYVEDRRARLLAAETTLTGSGWKVLLWLYDNTCVYCMKQFDNLEQDHIVPLSRGGNHTPQNVVPACVTCNRQKGVSIKMPEHPVWWAIVDFLTRERNSTTPALPA